MKATVAVLLNGAILASVASAQDFEGRVVEDSSGRPLASAELRFRKAGMRELAADLETDREGRFTAPGLPAGEYSVEVSKPNYVTTALRLAVPCASPLIRLVRFGVIAGQATDVGGRPLPGRILAPGGRTIGSTRITVMVKPPGQPLRSFRETALDPAGHYRVHDLPPGEYAVALWYSGLKEGSGMQFYPEQARPQTFTVNGGEEFRDVNFTVTPSLAWRVTGKVLPPKSGGVFAVALGLPEQPALPVAQALTEADGSFRFEKVPPGSYDLLVAGPTSGYTAFASTLGGDEPLFGRARVDVTAQDVEGMQVALSRGRSLGVVLRARGSGTPQGCPRSAVVSLAPLEPWGVILNPSLQANFEGEQVVRNLPPGRFRLTATGLGTGCFQANDPVADLGGEGAAPVAVELCAATAIRGVLRGAARAADFTVVLLDSENTRLSFPDTEGRFRFEGLRPGRYRIAAKSAADAPRDLHLVEIEVAGGAPTDVELPVVTKGDRP